MIPAWYAAAGMLTTGLLGAVSTHIAGSGRRTRLLKRTTRVVAELRRLTTWMPSAQYWEAGIREDRWAVWSRALPAGTLQPRLTAHAALAPAPNWHRREHRIYSWGWAVEVVQRLASIGAKANLPLAVEEYRPRHRQSVGEVTQEFRRIVAAEFGAQRCDSCTVGRDGEPSHISCVGCSCPCTVVEPLPAGVEGHSIGAGATR